MNVLVTGGAGFIGSHTVERLLADGHHVSIIDNFNDYYDPAIKRENIRVIRDRISVIEGDIRDAAVVEQAFAAGGFDAIIHLAARAGDLQRRRAKVVWHARHAAAAVDAAALAATDSEPRKLCESPS
jgi:nucleoside-diphosphate-sugar epimerase